MVLMSSAKTAVLKRGCSPEQYCYRVRSESMKITITIQDTENGQIKVSEERKLNDGESEESMTSARALADAIFELMDQLGEID